MRLISVRWQASDPSGRPMLLCERPTVLPSWCSSSFRTSDSFLSAVRPDCPVFASHFGCFAFDDIFEPDSWIDKNTCFWRRLDKHFKVPRMTHLKDNIFDRNKTMLSLFHQAWSKYSLSWTVFQRTFVIIKTKNNIGHSNYIWGKTLELVYKWELKWKFGQDVKRPN